MTLLWRVIAVVCVVLGLIGLLLPIVPTVPFLLVAAAAGSRGWPWLEQRLLNHATFGPIIVRWRERRVIPRGAKWMATWGMAAGSAAVWFTPVPTWVQVAVAVVMLPIALWIWLRPEN